MVTQDQSQVLAFLGSASTHGGGAVQRIDTHSAAVFLSGDRAWKLKRAVRYDYLDFSTPERRRQCCEAEVALNRRTAPGLYRGVVPVTLAPDGTLALGGPGTAIDWVIEMTRFDQSALFDRLAANGRLGLDLMEPLAARIARMHRSAPPRRDCGGFGAMRSIIAGNASALEAFGPDLLDAVVRDRVIARTNLEFDRVAYRLERRRVGGRVRQCHGDLHLGNVVLLDGEPTLFDAIEFNDEIAGVDVCYDIAFLLMDLWAADLRGHANRVWNVYLRETLDYDAASLLPLFLSCRAVVRAKTLLTAATEQPAAAGAAGWREASRKYLALADGILHPVPAMLAAVGGLSGSGKSTLARELAPKVGAVPGAVILRSDEMRRELFGVAVPAPLPPDAYADDASARVYAALCLRAERLLCAGASVIADAVFLRDGDRTQIESVAEEAGATFAGLWLEAPTAIRLARVAGRLGDASEADAGVMAAQEQRAPGAIAWRRVDAAGDVEQASRAALPEIVAV